MFLEPTRTRLDRLITINRLLANALEPEELIGRILDGAIQLFSAEGGAIALVDEVQSAMVFVSVQGGGKEVLQEFRLILGQGIIGWVAQTGRGVICNDAAQHPHFFGEIDQRSGFHTRSILCAPLKSHDQLFGAIEVINTRHPEGFTEADLESLHDLAELAVPAIQRTRSLATMRNANAAFQESILDRYHLVLGASAPMQEVVRLARTVAATNTTVLLLGESGTGKEVMARAIHQWSLRAESPFVAVNCTSLTAELLESELFGHERGAFTGAVAKKKGKFEVAEGGTIFLDEIGDLSAPLQAKLLRVLQEKEFQRVGGLDDIHANVRVLAATNRDLRQAIREGTFREDLFYRLNVVSLTLPALRDRKEDIPQLITHFLNRYCHEVKRAHLGIEGRALMSLQHYAWPGNVRELQNAMERAVVLSPGPHITLADLPPEVQHDTPIDLRASCHLPLTVESLSLVESTIAFQISRIRQALTATGGNQHEAAKRLGLSPSNLSRLMKRLRLR